MMNFNSKNFSNYFFFNAANCLWLTNFMMLCAAIFISFVQFPKLNFDNNALEKKIHSLEVSLLPPLATRGVKESSGFPAELARFGRAAEIASDLQEIASKKSVMLSYATYTPIREIVNVEIGRIEINTHLKGAYLQLKKIIADLLVSHTGLALESISVRRNRSTDALVEAELRFTFYYRK